MLIRKMLIDSLTERNGTSFCSVRITSMIGFIHYLVMSTIAIFNHSATVNLVDMATGLSIVVGVVSAGIGLKNGTEKKDD